MGYIYKERESKDLEFKSKPPSFHTLIKTCVAFSNGNGGKIIIGVDDKTRQVIGIDEATRCRLYDEFPNSVYDATSPSLLVEIYEQHFCELGVLIIEVPRSIKKPVFIKSDGIPKGVYLRAGSNTRHASQEYIEELMRENKRINFDEEMVQEESNVLSSALIQKVFGQINTDQLVSEKVLTPSHVRTKHYYPTVAGVLVFCENPQYYIAEAFIQCSRFHGTEGRNIIQSEEITGNVEKQLETSFQLVKSWITRDYRLIGTKLKGSTLIPEVALREAIVNAVLHRKYWIPGSIKIALYDDRLEIFNPGNFPGMIDSNNLGDGTTYLRNPLLVRLARRLGLIEKLGTGIRLIFESCQKSGLKKPEFLEGPDSVKVIFYFLPSGNDFSDEGDQLMALFLMREIVKVKDVISYLGVSRNTASRKLAQLVGKGKIVREGKGPSCQYKRNQTKI
jgi:ATP-dependent DNA helicase RecG